MATVEQYETKAGKRYRVRYRTPEGRQTTKRGFTTKRDAKAFMATVEVSKMKGEYVTPALGRVSVDELSTEWLRRKEAKLARSSYRPVESAYRLHVKPRWGSVSVSKVEHDEVEAWVADLVLAGHSATIVRRCHQALAGIMDLAEKQRRVASNPARGIEGIPAKRPKPRNYLSVEQLWALAQAARAEFQPLVLVLGLVGLRWSEAIALRPMDVDVARGRIHVQRGAVEDDWAAFVVSEPKGDEARSVPIPDALAPMIRGLVSAAEKRGGHEALLFPPRRGTEFLTRPDSGSGWLDGAVKRSGVPRVTAHDLRHTAASIAVSAGASVLSLARMLGHAPDVCLRIYADLFDSDLDAVAAAISSRVTADLGEDVVKMWSRDSEGVQAD